MLSRKDEEKKNEVKFGLIEEVFVLVCVWIFKIRIIRLDYVNMC